MRTKSPRAISVHSSVFSVPSCSTAVAALIAAAFSVSAQTPHSLFQAPREVLAFYYPWYGTAEKQGKTVHWGKINAEQHDISDSTHYPAQGAYDSHDPALVERQIKLAKANGITGFIHSWWGQNRLEDEALPIVLAAAGKENFKVSVYWETAPAKERAQIDHAINDLTYLLTKYATNPAFLKVDGKPVIFVYGRVMGEVPLSSWPDIISGARAKSGDFLLIADGYHEKYARQFDGLHAYNICSSVKGKSPDALRAWAAKHYGDVVKLARDNHRISCVDIIPGYDDTKIRHPGLKVDRLDGQVYSILWDETIKASPDWVLITSWNEWHEGSEIEPSLEYGDKYLTLTKEYTERFRPK